MSALLEIKNLHAYYGKSHVLHGVDLVVNQGAVSYTHLTLPTKA